MKTRPITVKNQEWVDLHSKPLKEVKFIPYLFVHEG